MQEAERNIFKKNSLVYQNFNFDLFYRQINITNVKGPLVFISVTMAAVLRKNTLIFDRRHATLVH